MVTIGGHGMKIRNGFVSNSSSTSFYIDSSIYTKQQVIEAIEDMVSDGLFAKYRIDQLTQKEIISQIEEWCGYTINGKDIPYNCIVVDSESDNSIDWDIQEMLEIKFNAYRQHWG
jgi:hypothetical protein